jgi:hypothetical protein
MVWEASHVNQLFQTTCVKGLMTYVWVHVLFTSSLDLVIALYSAVLSEQPVLPAPFS